MEDKGMTINPFLPLPVIIVIAVLLLIIRRKGIANLIKQIIIVLLLVAINLRIMIPTNSVEVMVNDFDILFVVDDTISMLAEDYSGSRPRLDGVKHDVGKIVAAFPGARFGLISFANTAEYVVPFTTESNRITDAIDGFVGQLPSAAEGTDFEDTVDTMESVLVPNTEEEELEDDNRIKLVFFISDGELTSGGDMGDFEDLAEYIDGGAVLGYGSEKGGRMSITDLYGTTEYLTVNGTEAKSKIDEDNLMEIASQLGVDYYHMQRRSTINSVLKEIHEQMDSGELQTVIKSQKGYAETYYYFTGALVIVLIWDFISIRRKLGQER